MKSAPCAIVSLDEGLRLLKPILPILQLIPAEAFRRYNDHVRPILPLNGPRGMGSDLHEICAQIAREDLGSRPGVTILDEPTSPRFLVNYRNRALIQFKTLGSDRMPTNSPTESAKKFDSQVTIEGLPHCARFCVGPQVSVGGVELLASLLVCMRAFKKVHWYHDLVTGQGVEALEFPNLGMPSDGDRDDEVSNGEASDRR